MNLPMQLITPLGLTVLVATLITAIPAPAADSLTSLFGDPVIATGKNVEVKRSQLDEAFISYRANLAARNLNQADKVSRVPVQHHDSEMKCYP